VKAILCKAYGPPSSLVLADLPAPPPKAGEIAIDVKAAGVNFPDVLIVQGKYQFKPEPPFSPGAEVAGLVSAVGEGVTAYRVGDRVAAHMLWGGYAEVVCVPAADVVPLPEGIDWPVAASFSLTYGTSYYALKDRAALDAGETLLVLGASGGVGLAAVELGKLMGARVIAAASSAEKLETCKRYGADAVIDYEREDLREAIKKHTAGRGVDVVYDPVGGKYSEHAVRGLAWGGRHLVVGFAAGEIPRIPLNLMLLKGASIVGVFWGQFTRVAPDAHQANARQLTDWIAAGRLRPLVSKTYPFAAASAALEDMMNRRVQGKVALVVGA